MQDVSVVEIISSIGSVAIRALNGSSLKDRDPQLYYRLKDAAVILLWADGKVGAN